MEIESQAKFYGKAKEGLIPDGETWEHDPEIMWALKYEQVINLWVRLWL